MRENSPSRGKVDGLLAISASVVLGLGIGVCSRAAVLPFYLKGSTLWDWLGVGEVLILLGALTLVALLCRAVWRGIRNTRRR
jgi:hypothetical protein